MAAPRNMLQQLSGPVDLDTVRFTYTAYCMSPWCASGPYNGTERPGLSRNTIDCPRCGHALQWKTTVVRRLRRVTA